MDFLPPPNSNGAASQEPPDEEFRELTPEEIASIAHVFQENNTDLPNPSISTFVGCLRKGKVVGFLVLQAMLHAEPMWIEPGNSDIFQKLAHIAESTILKKCGPSYVYLFAPAGRITQLAQTMGMKLEPWCVLSKLVMPEVPSKSGPFLMPLEDLPVEGAPV